MYGDVLNNSLLIKVFYVKFDKKKRNLLTVWLDYRKAFDSVPHDWIIKALQLAKVPKNLVESIKILTKQWATILMKKLLDLVTTFSRDVCMDFGIDKCA